MDDMIWPYPTKMKLFLNDWAFMINRGVSEEKNPFSSETTMNGFSILIHGSAS